MYDALLQLLQTSPVALDPRITDLKIYGRNAFRVKMRATITSTLTLQIWLNHNPRHTRYAYQLFAPNGAVIRWDNAPHHPHAGANFPHHLHDDQGQVTSSTLQGDPLSDLALVLAEIAHYLSASQGS